MAADRLVRRRGRLRRRRGRRGTVRARTTAAATLIVGLALLAGGAAMQSLLHRSLVRNVDDVADIRADDVAALVGRGPLPNGLALEDDAVGQVVDDDGRVLAASPNVGSGAPVSNLRPRGDEPVMRTVDHLPGLGGRYRLLAQRAPSPQGPVTIYIGTSLEPVDETLTLVRTSQLIGAPLLLTLVAVVTWMTVGRTLRPVEAIRSQVAELSDKRLDRRVPVPAGDDEIGRLARTMNEMLDRLQAAAEKQRRFVADASHELQTPLAAVRADLEVALTHPGVTSWPDVATDLLDENRHMEQLVADLLFVARTDHGAPPPPCSPVDLHEIVLDEAARLTASRRVHVDASAVQGAVVRGRRGDLTRAVRNLLDNAERHAQSTVTIALRNGAGTVSLMVDDDGPGVPPDQRARIFERFARLDDDRSRRTGGTGLGLAIVKDIVEGHHGHVAVHDSPTGARFVVTLPPDD